MNENCPRCGAPRTRSNSLFTYYGCGSVMGEQFEQSERCKRNVTGYQSNGPHDKSSCCGAPIDASQSIQSGRYAGHGRYYCSKCGKLAYIV